ncbi:MAG: hypothetical protein LQ338_001574 [Usnochroma carphineum]|nr:MAG: hypothetical protein LQ338_001574 [Usnochroma carphineum]
MADNNATDDRPTAPDSIHIPMPPIAVDTTFPSLLAFKAALRQWAIERNFTPHILDSDSHRVRAGCRSSPNCPFRIRCNWNEKRRIARVTTCEDVHDCISSTTDSHVHQDIKRAETGRLKFLVEAVPQLLDVSVTTSTTAIIDAVQRRYGQRIPLRQAQKVKRELAGRIHGPCRYCRVVGHSRRNCPVRREREAAGIMAPPTPEELGPQHLFRYSNHEMTPHNANGYHRSSEGRRCTLCLQPGHTQGNCPTRETTPNGRRLDSHQGYEEDRPSQPPAYSIPHEPSSHDDDYNNPELSIPNHSAQADGPLTPQPRVDPALEQSEPSQPTPKEIQAEAARLMQEAARLMNEAAMMNAEAARLTASIQVT